MTIVLDSHDATIVLKYKWFMATISDTLLNNLSRQNTNLSKDSIRSWNKGFLLVKQYIISTEDNNFWIWAIFQVWWEIKPFLGGYRERNTICESRLNFVSCFGWNKILIKWKNLNIPLYEPSHFLNELSLLKNMNLSHIGNKKYKFTGFSFQIEKKKAYRGRGEIIDLNHIEKSWIFLLKSDISL